MFECFFDGLRMSGGYLLYSAPNLKNTYIKKETINNQQPFVALATQMLLLNQQLQEKRSRFLHRLRDNLGVEKMTSALETFDLLDFKGLLSELKKQKKQISLSQQDEWEDYFNDYREQCQQLSKDIDETNKQIDLKVYHLYDLTYDEVLIVDPQTTITEAEYKE